MICAFQDRENIYLVMDLMTGGDLRYYIARHKKFSEEQASNIIQNLLFVAYYWGLITFILKELFTEILNQKT